MHALLVSAGTYGNMLPFLGLGKALRARGHAATLIGSGYCRDMARREGLAFVDLDDPEARTDGSLEENTRRRWRFFRTLRKRALRQVPRVYRFLAERNVPGETVVVASSWLFGSRLAGEKLNVPLASVQLQPLLFQSVYDTWGRGPLWGRRLRKRLTDWLLDRRLAPAIDAFRAEIGLPPAPRPVRAWGLSPDLILGFFPGWYSPPQPDWPVQTVLAGFPLYDALEERDDTELRNYLDSGEPPLVFSQASLVKDARGYFAASAEAARLLGRRAALLTPHRQQIPQPLPSGVRHFEFARLSTLLPRAAAIVHHGGMGTIGQALAAGIPQLTVPGLLDQFDNGRRLLRLGVSANLRASAYRPAKVARALRGLLDSAEVAERCRHYAALCREEKPFEEACRALEKLYDRAADKRREMSPA